MTIKDEIRDSLKECASILGDMSDPNKVDESISVDHLWARCVAAERKANASLAILNRAIIIDPEDVVKGLCVDIVYNQNVRGDCPTTKAAQLIASQLKE